MSLYNKENGLNTLKIPRLDKNFLIRKQLHGIKKKFDFSLLEKSREEIMNNNCNRSFTKPKIVDNNSSLFEEYNQSLNISGSKSKKRPFHDSMINSYDNNDREMNISNIVNTLENVQIRESPTDAEKRNFNKPEENKILINISNMYNKGIVNYHRKKVPNERKQNILLTEPHEVNSKTDQNIMELKLKITELMEQNSQLLYEKDEIRRNNQKLLKDLSTMKDYLIHTKVEDMKKLSKELEFYQAKMSENHTLILNMKKENENLTKEIARLNLQELENLKKNEMLISKLKLSEDLLKNKEKEYSQLKKMNIARQNPNTLIQKQQTFGISYDN